ncbi:unnamed protein product [Camellia sinensis]
MGKEEEEKRGEEGGRQIRANQRGRIRRKAASLHLMKQQQNQSHLMAQNRARNTGRHVGPSPSAWPTLQQALQPQQQPSSGMRAVFLGNTGSKRECAGTGVFLPRPIGSPTETRKKSDIITYLKANILHKLHSSNTNLKRRRRRRRRRRKRNKMSEEKKIHLDVVGMGELKQWSFYKALIAEFVATLLFLYVTIATVIGHKKQHRPCDGVGLLGIAWSFGGMIFVLVYCTAGISKGHINPAVTFGMLMARKVTLVRALAYMAAQCLGAICGAALVKAFMKHHYMMLGGGANSVAAGYSRGSALGAEIFGTFILVYTVFSATDPEGIARDAHVPVLAPLAIGIAVFMVHLATIPITGTGINPARSLGPAVIFNNPKVWHDQWIFWVGPFVGALAAAIYHQYVLRTATTAAAITTTTNSPRI